MVQLRIDDDAGYVKQLSRNLQPQLQALAAEVLDTISPLQDVRKPAKLDHDAVTKRSTWARSSIQRKPKHEMN